MRAPCKAARLVLVVLPIICMGSASSAHAVIFPKLATSHSSSSNALSILLEKNSAKSLFAKPSSKVVAYNFNSTLYGSGSLATRHMSAVIRSTVITGVRSGENSIKVTGGALTGQVQGDLYTVSYQGNTNTFLNVGEFTGIVGTNIAANNNTNGGTTFGTGSINPAFPNTLSFTPQITSSAKTHNQGVGLLPSFLLSRVPGSQRAFLSSLSSLSGRAVGLGQQIGITKALASGGSISSGILFGTAYRNSLGNSTFVASSFTSNPPSPMYIFAFGNNPLNNPALIYTSSTILLPGSSSFVFSNGVTKNVSGQILFPTVGIDGLFHYGSVLTFGTNPFNNNLLGSTTANLSSFLTF